jgi:hypothetical protein
MVCSLLGALALSASATALWQRQYQMAIALGVLACGLILLAMLAQMWKTPML